MRGRGQDGCQEVSNEPGPSTVDAKVGFQALGGFVIQGHTGATRIVEQDIEPGFGCEELSDGWGDGGEICEIKGDEVESAWGACVDCAANLLDGSNSTAFVV